MPATAVRPASERNKRGAREIDAREMHERVNEILNRRPAVGLAVGVVRNGCLEFFHGHGLADIASRTPITEDTVFRVGSLTKVITAVAVMQLLERGLVDLDAPANDYLRAHRLVPAQPGFGPATVRHLLTHTAGIPEVAHIADLLHPDWGAFDARPAAHSVKPGERMLTLADYYRGGLRVVAEPGSAFAYTNHGFATLGQIVEDVSETPLDRYVREHIFQPLGMADTDLVRSDRIRSRLATGYDLGPGGPRAVPDREWVTVGASNTYSSTRDMARFAAALLAGGSTERGTILQPGTLASMFEAHYQPDPRLPGMGLCFFLSDTGGHRVAGHDGVLPGFHSQLLLAPDDGVGVIACTNGSRGAFTWLPIELGRLLGELIGASDGVARSDVPHHPEIWGEICGRYELPPRVSDLRGRLMLGGGVQVFVGGGRLMARILTPVPALYRGLPLQPDDASDPYAFRINLSPFGMPAVRVVFNRDAGRGTTALHTDLQSLSLWKRPATNGQRRWVSGALGACAVVTAATAVRRRRGHGQCRLTD